MGRSITPRYSMSMETVLSRAGKARYTDMIWRCKEYGSPTLANLDKWVTTFEQSCINGPNKHVGYDPIVSATIYDQYDGRRIVVQWVRSKDRNEPLFQVIET